MKLGLEVLLEDKKLLNQLKKKRCALVCHPASVDQNLKHSLDLLAPKINITCAFGPQHGVRGDKQDNMVESDDFLDSELKIPIFSLYGKVRRPTPEMLSHCDVVIFDLQDLGCRIYTFITTLLYIMEECAQQNKEVIVLDRPNPAGREVEGFSLISGWESFVGAAPIPMRHGLTVGELALYFKEFYKLSLSLKVIKMKGYSLSKKPGYGWDMSRTWINPSPNAANLNMARAYAGTVLIEGTTLSEGRGTTRALEVIGAPDIDFKEVLVRMKKIGPQWLKGCIIREVYFEPTFHKHAGKLCHGIHIHTDNTSYNPTKFKPFRIVALMLKAIREIYPQYPIYRDFAYEYVFDRLAFDVINGGPALREWIENPKATAASLDKQLQKDEAAWKRQFKKYFLYNN
ncbi:MAG: exo-beta-N-acetylmuramidase NamZ domain-containing protein [Bdellovibrionia bacterium]